MKKKTMKRIVSLGLIVGILASVGIGAYLTSTDVKEDVYTVGNVQAEIIANGDMELDNVGALLPGTVHQYERAAKNTGINDAYVFMSITIPYEAVGASNADGTQIGERTRQLFIPGVDGGYIGSEWKLVDVGYIGQYEIEDNGQYCGEHDKYSAVVGDTITYVYGYIGDNADGSLKALASGETTSNLVETMKLTNLYHADKITGEVSTKLYAIQSNNVNGGLTDVNGVWAVINKALAGEVQEASTLTYSINNTKTGEAVGYAPLKLVDENGNVVATSVANENGNGQFENVPAGSYTVETDVGDLSITNAATTYATRRTFTANRTASIEVTNEDRSVNFGLTTVSNTLVPGPVFRTSISDDVTRIEFVKNKSIPANAIDVSEAQDGSVMAWVSGTIAYVCSTDGRMIYTNPNSSHMFYDKPNLTYINTDNLNTFYTTDGAWMFCSRNLLTNTIEDFDFSNMRNYDGAFTECSWLTTITIPEGTVRIPTHAFFKCSNLTSVVIPSSVKSIGNGAFSSTGLTSINIPEGVEEIGDGAFYGCNLTEIYIPASVKMFNTTEFGLQTFQGNDNLTAINVDLANKNYASVNGVLFSKDMKTLLYYPLGKSSNSYTVPNGVSTIYDSAFYDNDTLVSIVLPQSLKTIGSNAFAHSGNLEVLNIPASVSSIGENAFIGTQWLNNKLVQEGIVVVNGIWISAATVIGDVVLPDGLTSIPASAFYQNKNMTSIRIPASVKTIEDSAFERCSALTTVIFEEGSQLKSIGNKAFEQCDVLTSINLPEGVEEIGDGAFYSCDVLSYVSIPNSVTAINNNAFAYCSKLDNIVIPSNATSIGSGAFNNTKWLNDKIANGEIIIINNTLVNATAVSGEYTIPTGATTIDDYAFSGNSDVTKITIPASVTSIGDYAFESCTSLEAVIFENGSKLKSIGEGAFFACESLTLVKLPNSLEVIKPETFYGCISLTSITLPSTVNTIGSHAFADCENLASVNLPEGLTFVGEYAFSYCSLTSITIPNSLETFENNVFSLCNNLTEIIVADNHSNYTTINGVLFSKDMKTLILYPAGKADTSYVVPEGVKTIANNAFYGSKVSEIIVPTSVDVLSDYCFAYCSNLKNIYYCGTRGQWYDVGFGLYWNKGVHSDFIVSFDYVSDN